MINWMIKRYKKKKLSKLPRKRRIFEHQAEPLIDELYMKHRIRAYEIKFARIGQNASEHLRGCDIEILYFSKMQCEVQLLNSDIPSFYLPTHQIDFSPIQPSSQSIVTEGEFVHLTKEIKSDDELKGVLGEEGDELLIIKVEPNEEYPYWAYDLNTKEFFRVIDDEIYRLNKRIPVEIL